MTGPPLEKDQLDDEIDRLIKQGLSEDEITFYLKDKMENPEAYGRPQKGILEKLGYDPAGGANIAAKTATTTARGLRQLDRGAQAVAGLVTKNNQGGILGRMVRGSADFMERRAGELEKEVQQLNPDPTFYQRTDRAIGSFIGTSIPYMATGAAISRALAPVTELAAGKLLGGALARTTASKAAQAGIIKSVAAAPGQAAGIAAIEGPEVFVEQPLLSAGSVFLGSSLEGLGRFLTTAKQLRTLAADPASPVSTKDIVREVENFRKHWDVLVQKELDVIPSSRPPVPRPTSAPKIEVEVGFRPKEWNPQTRKVKKADPEIDIPAGEEVQYWAKEGAKLQNKAAGIARRLKKELADIEKHKDFSEERMLKIEKLERDLLGVQADYDRYVAPYLFESTTNQHGLKFSANESPSTVIRFGRNTAENFPDTRSEWPPVRTTVQQVDDAVRLLNSATTPVKFLNPFEKAVFYTQNRALPIGKISPESESILNNMGATAREAQLAISHEMLLPDMVDGKWTGVMKPVLDAAGKAAKPLGKIIEEAKALGQYHNLERLIKARRTVADPTKATDMPLKEAESFIAGASDDLLRLSNDYEKVTNWMVDYLASFGRLSAKQAEEFKSLFYAPQAKVFNNPMVSSFLKERKGSGREALPELEQTAKQIFQVIEKAKKNYAFSRLIDDFELNKEKFAGLIEPFPQPATKEIDKLAAEIVKDRGVTHATARKMAELELGGTLDKSDGTLLVIRNGEAFRYKIHPVLERAVDSFSPLETGVLVDMFSALSRPLREGIAASLDLSGWGPLSDAVVASSYDPGFRFFIDPVRGLWHTLLKSPTYRQSVAAGAGFGGRYRADRAILPDRTLMQKLNPAHLVGDGFEAINNFIRPLSNASRMGLYLSQIRQGKTPLEAATFSNNVIGNWNKVGASMRAWSRATEFGNVGIQSAEAFTKALNKARQDPKAAASLLATSITAITLPTLAFLAASEGDDEITALRKAEDYSFWYWRKYDGSIGKMRKTGWFLSPIFGSAVEMAWDGADTASRKRLAESLLNEVGFNSLPASMQTMIGLATNSRNPLFGSITGYNAPVTPTAQNVLDPVAQGNANTSHFAKRVGEAAGVSPFKVDFALDRFLSPAGANFLRFPEGRMGGKRDIPIFSRYDVAGSAQTEGSKLFYEDLRRAMELDKTLQKLPDIEREAWAQKHPEEFGRYSNLAKIAQSVALANEYMRMISQDPEITRDAKMKEIAEIRSNLNEFFREYATYGKE